MRLAQEKVIPIEELTALVEELKGYGQKMVFTNGCFDLLHVGHVRYLQKARSMGDFLVVAINSDSSVYRLKGPGRPVQTEGERAEILGALDCVDFVTFFDDETPQQIVDQLVPHVLAKGGDWPLDQIVGRETVEAGGGFVVSIPFEEGYSTTDILKQVRETL
jgi:D-beta-D-heptose 7-phosphate kinase/D-beta-D-heptose 1-phosphate adenosyltransferase